MSLDRRIVMPPAKEFQGLSPEELPKGLEGLVVVELGDYVAMPACTRALGEMGATVYKIETIKGRRVRYKPAQSFLETLGLRLRNIACPLPAPGIRPNARLWRTRRHEGRQGL